MTSHQHPAAYIRIPGTGSWAWHAMKQAAIRRGWPEPVIYAEEQAAAGGSYGPAMDKLESAIVAGRHDALLIAAPESPDQLMRLLSRCTKYGVAVSFLPGPAAFAPGAEAATTSGSRAAAQTWEVLARARLEALAELFPDWRVWVDRHGWHGRRRDHFMQGYRPGAPAFHVTAETAHDLAAQLCWQRAAESHVPDGCQGTTLCPPAPVSR